MSFELTLPASEVSRLRRLQALGILCGFSAGAWLGAAEATTKLVTIGVSPLVISLIMVVGVFLARWSVPALIRGMSQMRADAQQAPHLIVWAVLAGCLWAVANTMTIFAVRDIGLGVDFPLWNTNSLLGIFGAFFCLMNCSRPAGRAGSVCSVEHAPCFWARRCSPLLLPRRAPRSMPFEGFRRP